MKSDGLRHSPIKAGTVSVLSYYVTKPAHITYQSPSLPSQYCTVSYFPIRLEHGKGETNVKTWVFKYVKLLHKSSIINRVKFELLAVFYMWILQRTYTANCKSLLPTGFESHQCLSYLHLRAYSTKEGYSLKLPLVQCWLHLQLQKILSVRKKNSF